MAHGGLNLKQNKGEPFPLFLFLSFPLSLSCCPLLLPTSLPSLLLINNAILSFRHPPSLLFSVHCLRAFGIFPLDIQHTRASGRQYVPYQREHSKDKDDLTISCRSPPILTCFTPLFLLLPHFHKPITSQAFAADRYQRTHSIQTCRSPRVSRCVHVVGNKQATESCRLP